MKISGFQIFLGTLVVFSFHYVCLTYIYQHNMDSFYAQLDQPQKVRFEINAVEVDGHL